MNFRRVQANMKYICHRFAATHFPIFLPFSFAFYALFCIQYHNVAKQFETLLTVIDTGTTFCLYFWNQAKKKKKKKKKFRIFFFLILSHSWVFLFKTLRSLYQIFVCVFGCILDLNTQDIKKGLLLIFGKLDNEVYYMDFENSTRKYSKLLHHSIH